MTQNTDAALRRTVDDLIAPGTPESVRARYRSLAALAGERDFGPLTDDVVVLDTETTGLSFRNCELIEIAAARMSEGRVVEEFRTFVKPKKPIPAEITELTGITNGDVVDAPDARTAVAALAAFVGGAPVLAHNAVFDRTFVTNVKGGGEVSDIWIDTLALSRIALPRLTSHRLSDMAEAFGCDDVSHRAMDDVYALAGMWPIILAALACKPEGLLRLLSETHPEVDWPYRPLFSYLADERDDGPFSLVEARKRLLEGVPLSPRKDAKELGELSPVDKNAVAEAFSAGGLVGGLYEQFEPRSEQRTMAEAVTQALNTSGNLAVEAGTGVGKSMAYLLPLALYARRNNVTCGVATKTNALTDQLMTHELPALSDALGGLSFTSLKGYDHYPCLRKVEAALRDDLPVDQVPKNGRSQNTVMSDMLTALAVTLSSVCDAPEGDLDSLGIRWGSVPRSMLTTTSQECQHRRCPFFAEGCLLHGARRRAASADVVVTNHSLLLRDVAAEGRILPPVRHWVVDEAHSFDSEARRQWALEASAASARQAFEMLGGLKTGAVHKLMVQANGSEAGTTVARLLTKAAASANRAKVASADFFDALFELVRANHRGASYDTTQVWVDEALRQTPEWALVSELGLALAERLDEAARFADEAQALAQDSVPNATGELERPVRDLREMREALVTVLQGTDESYLFYAEACLQRNRRGDERLVAEKLDVGEALAERWYPETMSVTFCSATMAVGEDFSHFEQSVGFDRLGPGEVRTLQLASSYDYDNAMAVVLPQNLPDPYSRSYLPALAEALYTVHTAMGGSVLTLFTNRRDMEWLYNELEPRLSAAGLVLRQQDRRANVRRLREQFVKDEASSLFALKSFWEGFDAAGDTLRCVVIPKLPFANPNDPLVKERERRDRRAWWRHSLPEAVLAVKQAAGRLIRSSSDKGVLVLCDSRLVTKRYGSQFIKSLPSKNVTRLDAERLGPYLSMWRASHER